MTGKLYYKYWGKAKSDNNSGVGYHLLPYHCLDVGRRFNGGCIVRIYSDNLIGVWYKKMKLQKTEKYTYQICDGNKSI
jgi:(2Fe-2S) ferredoxin